MATQPEPIFIPTAPTPEQLRRSHFELGIIWERRASGVPTLMGKAYRRRPHFETLDLGSDQLAALSYYRRQWDRVERSEVRCSLAVAPGSGDGDGPSPGWLLAKQMLEIGEAGLGARRLGTLRAVALFDASFSEVALQRFGSLRVSWRLRRSQRYRGEVIRPSTRARQLVAAEFASACTLLADQLRPFLRTG